MQFIINHWQTIMAAIGSAVTIATTIVAITPSQKDDAILAKVIKVIDFLSVINPKPKKA